MASPEVGIVGLGKVGEAYTNVFPEATLYDPYHPNPEISKTTLEELNECDVALVCVPTNLDPETRELDMTIVDKVIQDVDTDLIIIKSALQPGTAERLIGETGKDIAVSVEYVGEGNYFVPPWKYPDNKNPRSHALMVVGGSEETAEAAIDVLWRRMSPDTRIHKVTATEAEIIKLVENSYGAYKVTWANAVKSVADAADQSFVRIHQGWTADGRVDAMHTRVVGDSRGWASKCWDKDIIALQTYAEKVGATDMSELIGTLVTINQAHLDL